MGQEKQWEIVRSLREPEIERKLSWLFRGKWDPYTRAFAFATVAFAIYALAYAYVSSASISESVGYSIFIDAVTVFVALASYSRQSRSLVTSLEKTRHLELFTIASRKVSTPEDGSGTGERIVIFEILWKIFWSKIVQRFPKYAYPANKSSADKRWRITGLFTTLAVAVWIIIILAAHAYTMGPLKEGAWWWLGYSLYFAVITIWAIPIAMLPPRELQGITEQCWFVFKSHIVYDIPLFYAAVAFSYSLFFSEANAGVNPIAILQACELAFVVFFMGVVVVTLLDTSITIWTLLNSGQLNYLELMTADSYGGMGPFYSLINWNTIVFGILATLQFSRIIVPVLTSTHVPLGLSSVIYTIPAVIGVPLLMALTWGASVYFLHKRTIEIKQHYIMEDLRPNDDHETTQKQWPVPVRCLPERFRNKDELAVRDRIAHIQSWPRTSSIVATALGSGYLYIIRPLLASLGFPV